MEYWIQMLLPVWWRGVSFAGNLRVGTFVCLVGRKYRHLQLKYWVPSYGQHALEAGGYDPSGDRSEPLFDRSKPRRSRSRSKRVYHWQNPLFAWVDEDSLQSTEDRSTPCCHKFYCSLAGIPLPTMPYIENKMLDERPLQGRCGIV